MNIKYYLEVAVMFLIPLFVLLMSLYIGRRYGIYRSKSSKNLQETPVSTVVSAALGFLAFMLAFTFQIVFNRYETRKELLLQEVTNIRTTYLRAELIPEPYCTDAKKLLVEYVKLRIDLANDPSKLSYTKSRSGEILNSFWHIAKKLAEQNQSSEVFALYTTSVNDLVDNYNQRVAMAIEYRLPVAILWVLGIIAFFSMFTLGYQFGITGKGSFRINFLLVVIFSVVMVLILTLDRPEKGLTIIYQKPMFTLQQQLQVMQLNGKNH